MLAELARTGFYREVTVKSREAQERRALLAARDAATGARRNAENTIRGLLASFGIRLPAQPRTYEGRVRAALDGREALARILLPLPAAPTEALRQAAALTRELVRQTRNCEACIRLMTIPGVGADHGGDLRRHHRCAGPVQPIALGRRLRWTDVASPSARSRRLQRADLEARRQDAAHDPAWAANSLLCRVKPGRGQRLKDWAMAVKKRTSHRSAAVALARKLAVMMHAIWISGAVFEEARM